MKAFGVGALEEEDDDIYATETLSKYDTILKDEEPGDGLYGWTAPRQYKNQKGNPVDSQLMIGPNVGVLQEEGVAEPTLECQPLWSWVVGERCRVRNKVRRRETQSGEGGVRER